MEGRVVGLLIDPLVSFDVISEDELNWCLDKWNHKMGPLNRPLQYGGGAHGIRYNGNLVAVTAWSTLIRETCAGMEWLPRETTTELSRVCAERRDLCRVAVRLWREFAFLRIREERGHDWAVSYQDSSFHVGDLYRFDGWVKLGRFKSGGKDPRTGRKGRAGWVWGWHPEAAERRRRALSDSAQQALKDAA
jgi:antitoxin VapB